MRSLETVVLGCGNSLAGDDAVGLHVVERLRRCPGFADFSGLRVEVVRTGDALDAMDHLIDRKRAIITDAVITGASPGEVVEFAAGVIPERQHMRLSLHGFNLADALILLRRLYPGRVPPVMRVVGVEISAPPAGRPSRGLSAEAREAVPRACRSICKRLRGWSRELIEDA